MAKRKTNIQIVNQIMKSSKLKNPMIEVFVIDALGKMADAVIADTSDWTEGGTVNPIVPQAIWKDAAQQIKDQLDEHYGDS